MCDFLHHNDYHLMLGFDKDQVLRLYLLRVELKFDSTKRTLAN